MLLSPYGRIDVLMPRFQARHEAAAELKRRLRKEVTPQTSVQEILAMATNYDGAVEIASSPNFQRRIQYAMVEIAKEVLKEPLGTEFNAERVAFAQSVLTTEIEPGRLFAAAINVVVGNTSALDPDAENNGVDDTQVSGAIRDDWNDIAAIPQNV